MKACHWYSEQYPECKYTEVAWRYASYMCRNHFKDNNEVDEFVQKVKEQTNSQEIHTTFLLTDTIDNFGGALKYGPFIIDIDARLSDDSTNKYYPNQNTWNEVRTSAVRCLAFLHTVLNISYDDMVIFYSGRGLHIYVTPTIFGIEPNAKLVQIYKNMGLYIRKKLQLDRLDMQLYANRKTIRLHNTINNKVNLYKVQILSDELCKLKDVDDVMALASKPRGVLWPYTAKPSKEAHNFYTKAHPEPSKSKSNLPSVYTGEMYACVKNILENGAPSGHRNYAYCILASYYKQCGMSLEDTYEILTAWRYDKCSPSYEDDGEAMASTISVYNGEGKWGCSSVRMIGDYCDMSQCIINTRQ